jgi:N6-L-threonylcarbamoyladenine synthase
MTILGIESSCDETAVGIVQDGRRMLANTVVSQIDIHKVYGGVVPEIAARSHIEAIIPTIDTALNTAYPFLKDSSVIEKLTQIDAIAVTQGAGLGGSLLIGVMTARVLATTADKPLVPINHVEAHVYANFITETTPELEKSYQLPIDQPRFPLLALIVSGGHTQLVFFRGHSDYDVLGKTRDDAVGEAFDKVAKMSGLPYPGGPSIAEAAKHGKINPGVFPKAQVDGYDFSFSGLKTAVLRHAQGLVGGDFRTPSTELPERLSEAQKNDIAASFQHIAVETVVDKTVFAFETLKPASVVIAGGVASNDELRQQLASRLPIAPIYTDKKLCTDNGAMIAALGYYKAQQNRYVDPHDLSIEPSLKMGTPAKQTRISIVSK